MSRERVRDDLAWLSHIAAMARRRAVNRARWAAQNEERLRVLKAAKGADAADLTKPTRARDFPEDR